MLRPHVGYSDFDSTLRERHHPLRLARPVPPTAAAAEKELSLANPVRKLDARNRDGGGGEGFEPSHRCTASLDRPMILLNQVVEISIRSHLHVPPARVLTAQQPQRAMTGNVAIEGYFARHARKCARQCLAKECLRSGDASVSAQQEVNGLAVLVDISVQVVPLRLDSKVRLLDSPGSADRSGESRPALDELRNIAHHPSKDRRMRDSHATFGHHLDQIPIGEPVGHVPANAQFNDLGAETTLAVDGVTGNRLGHWSVHST